MRARALAPALVASLLLGCGELPRTEVRTAAPSPQRAWSGCGAFVTQPDAQRAWEELARPAGADGDGDGRVCETLPATTPAVTESCVRTEEVVDVGLSSTRYPNVVAHVEAAVAAGWPEVMTLNRAGAAGRRARLLRGVPGRPGHDRDEYPMAIGRAGWRAHVAHVPSEENRGAGSVVGLKLRRYCDGVRFRIVGY